MGVFLLTILMPVLAQADRAGELYEIQPNGGGDSYFAYVADPAAGLLQLQIYYKPGAERGAKATEIKSKVKIVPVGQDAADRTIERRLDSVSQMVNGVRVSNEEKALADRARAWADELDARLTVPDPVPADPGTEAEMPQEAPGPFAQRGPQIALAAGALVLVGIIVKLVILG